MLSKTIAKSGVRATQSRTVPMLLVIAFPIFPSLFRSDARVGIRLLSSRKWEDSCSRRVEGETQNGERRKKNELSTLRAFFTTFAPSGCSTRRLEIHPTERREEITQPPLYPFGLSVRRVT